MALACREYVTPHRAGTRKQDHERLLALKEALGPLMARSRSLRFAAKVLYRVRDLENELLDPRAILAASGGVLPVLWLNVTYQPADLLVDDLRPLEQRFDLTLLGAFVDDRRAGDVAPRP